MYDAIYRERNQTLKLIKEMGLEQSTMLMVVSLFVEEGGLDDIHATKEEIAKQSGLPVSQVPKAIESLLKFRTSDGKAVIERIGVDRYRLLEASGIVLDVPEGSKVVNLI